MNGFGNADIPEWVKDQFNEYTALPTGPMEQMPVPVEGQVVGAEACVPTDGRPARWAIRVDCVESVDHVMDFYEEFLPLSGYDLVGVGAFDVRRAWLSRRVTRNGLIVFRVGEYIGRLVARTGSEAPTEILIEIAHCTHVEVRDLADRAALRENENVEWTLRP